MDQKAKKIIQVSFFIVLMMAIFVVLLNPSITGMFYSIDSVKSEVESFVVSSPLYGLSDEFNVCIIILGDETVDTAAFKVKKNLSEGMMVYQDEYYCGGSDMNDIVIQFDSYLEFKDAYMNKDVLNFVEQESESYYFLPSKMIKEGGFPTCDEEFKEKYCPTLAYSMNDKKLESFFISCCKKSELDDATIAKIKNYEKEHPVRKIPAFLDLSLTTYIIAIVVILLLVSLALYFILRPKKNKHNTTEEKDENDSLYSYIDSTLMQGYSAQQIKQTLLQQGWPEEQIDMTINKVIQNHNEKSF